MAHKTRIKCEEFEPAGIECYQNSSKPVYYKDTKDHKEYLIIIGKHKSKTKLIKYDIENRSYQDFSEIDKLIQGPFGYAVHHNTNKLYLMNIDFSTSNHQDVFICDLKTGNWEILPKVLQAADYHYKKHPKFVTINDKIHILYHDVNELHHHYIFDINNHKMKEINQYNIEMNGNESIGAYLRELNKFIYFTISEQESMRIRDHKVWSMNTNDHDLHTECKWMQCNNVKIPDRKISVIIPYGNILVCFSQRMNFIWCLDVVEYEWYDSPKRCHGIGKGTQYFVPTNGGRYCYYYDDGHNDYCKIDLFDACPNNLQRKIQEKMTVKNTGCCFGYCREKEMELNLIVPDYLKRIVLRYYNELPMIENK